MAKNNGNVVQSFYCLNSLSNWNRVLLLLSDMPQKMISLCLTISTLFDGSKEQHFQTRSVSEWVSR